MDDTGDNVQRERDMPRNQYGIVEGCFEEGQYEAGIAVLNHLREPKYRPTRSQVRQLLYLALYPPSPSMPDNLLTARGFEPSSPSKFGMAKQQRAENFPTPSASEASCKLLASLALTNSPESLFSALPSYTSPLNEKTGWADDDQDSYLARASVCIMECKNCWAMLRGGFILPKSSAPAIPRRKERQRHRDTSEGQLDPGLEDVPPSSVVADHAWPVLGWFLSVFERDEMQAEKGGMPRHSPLLLSQISNPSSRPELDAPLDIITYSLEQADETRRDLGLSLFRRLIYLTSTPGFHVPTFLAAIYGRLISLTSQPLLELLGSMSHCPTGQRFKVALCKKYLTEALAANDIGNSCRRPIPFARTQPRALPTPGQRSSDDQSHASQVIAGRHTLPGSAEVIRLLEKPIRCPERSSHTVHDLYRIKFELLITYGTLQSQLPSNSRDEGWQAILAQGSLRSTTEAAFEMENEGTVFKQAAKSILALW